MRILEQSEDVLTLQNSATDFWSFNIVSLIFWPLIFMVFFPISNNGWWRSFWLVLLASLVIFSLINILKSNKVKVCSFNKTLSKVTVKHFGLQVEIKVLPLQNVRAVETRKIISYVYGAIVEGAQLWLLTENVGAILLSDENYSATSSEAIANQIREFLSLRSRSM